MIDFEEAALAWAKQVNRANKAEDRVKVLVEVIDRLKAEAEVAKAEKKE